MNPAFWIVVGAVLLLAIGSANAYTVCAEWVNNHYGHGSQVDPPANPPFWCYAKYQC